MCKSAFRLIYSYFRFKHTDENEAGETKHFAPGNSLISIRLIAIIIIRI